jgi:hypothetical protein
VAACSAACNGTSGFRIGKSTNSLARSADLIAGQIYTNKDADAEKAIREAVEARKSRYRFTFGVPLRYGKYHKARFCARERARGGAGWTERL